MCTREGFKEWHNSDMDIESFKRIVPFLKETEAVILEGWGESLLHKNLIEIIRLAKSKGPQVGFVTSGKGLNREYISEIINAGTDFIGFSLSGGSSGTHESIRVNSGFGDLLENISTFNQIKAERKLKKPKLHIVYLMLRDNIIEVPSMICIAKDIGIEDVVLINPTLVTNEWQESRRVFRCDAENSIQGFKGSSSHASYSFTPQTLEPSNPYEGILKEAAIKAKELNVRLSRPSLSPVDVPVCAENPLRNLYISVDGEVSPCVYLYPPTASPFRKVFCGDEYNADKVSFGNIFREPFYEIWNSRRYAEFRNCFAKRKAKSSGLSLLDIERLKRPGTEQLPEPPEQCKTCHKILGV